MNSCVVRKKKCFKASLVGFQIFDSSRKKILAKEESGLQFKERELKSEKGVAERGGTANEFIKRQLNTGKMEKILLK